MARLGAGPTRLPVTGLRLDAVMNTLPGEPRSPLGILSAPPVQ
jgi:hypothetical protein